MRRLLLIIAIIALCSSVWAGQGMGPGPGCKGYATSECTSKLICQNFETATSGWDNGPESWTAAGNYSAAYTTVHLRGNQSGALWLNGSFTSPTFTASDTIYFHFRLRLVADVTPSYDQDFFQILNSTTTIAKTTLKTDGRYTCRTGTASIGTGSITPSANTDYHVWGAYQKSTSSNGFIKIYIGTDTSKPASADCTSQNSLSSTSQADNIKFVYSNANDTNTMILDQIIVSTTEFTTVSE